MDVRAPLLSAVAAALVIAIAPVTPARAQPAAAPAHTSAAAPAPSPPPQAPAAPPASVPSARSEGMRAYHAALVQRRLGSLETLRLDDVRARLADAEERV